MKVYFKHIGLLFLTLIFCISSAFADNKAELIFDWAESEYAEAFSPRSTTQMIDGWEYRYYSDTDTYIGIDEAGQVAVLGEQFGDGIVFVGTVDEYLKKIVDARLIIESTTKSEAFKIISREYYGPVLEFKEIPEGSKKLENSATRASGGVYYCINNVWHWCVFIGGQWYCWPTIYTC